MKLTVPVISGRSKGIVVWQLSYIAMNQECVGANLKRFIERMYGSGFPTAAANEDNR